MNESLAELVYLPRPREIRPRAGAFSLRPGTRIALATEAGALLQTARRLKDAAARSLGMEWALGAGPARAGEQCITLKMEPGVPAAQGYRLSIDSSGIECVGADRAGLFHAVVTLEQIMRQSRAAIPAGEITDWPDFPVRGVMLDVSRDKVPTMDTLFSTVELLAGMKINHLQLYTEHTFAYSGHREVWADASPMTAEQVLLLDAFCRERFIELVPNQNSFGHLQKWLSLPRYQDLAECMDGFAWPWGGRSEGPFSLNPSHPGSLALIEELFDELLPNFESRLFNVGCDETFDVGQGRSRELCERVGKGRVYMDFLLKIHRLVEARGHTMLYWGDIIMEHPELVPELPPDAIALEWGYESHHPFDEHGQKFRAAGVPWWVCPGTSSWNSLAGRTENCLGNLRSAARAGLANGATGFLNTDWGDNGHWQFLPVSWLGLAAGAALSWHTQGHMETDFARELDAHVFHDRAGVMGGVARDLGNAYLHTGLRIHNESALFQVLRYPERNQPPEGLTANALADTRTWIETVAARLDGARMDRPDAELIRDEYALTVRMLLLGCDRAAGRAEGMSEEIMDIIEEYRRLWLARNRIGGLSDSVKRLEALIPAYM
jgi:hexosaminidase